jgi:hypothetical protein
MTQGTETLDAVAGIDQAFLRRVFHAFAALALASVAIACAGHWLGRSIALAGYTDDTTMREVVLGNNVLAVPSNAIRFADARRDGVADRLDLYLKWPEMSGYTAETRDDFNDTGGRKDILFLSFEPRMMSRDMSGRFGPIYRSLIEEPGTRGVNGLTFYAFKENTGYLDETLAVAERPGREPFVARCLTGKAAAEALAPCERDIALGDELSLLYRFPRELIDQWPELDAAVTAKAEGYLKTGK